MPRKVFTAGEVLTAADTNTFLSDQVVMTFADSAARGSAIGTAVEGMLTYLADTNTYEYWDGAAWEELANPMTTEGDIITAGTAGVPQRLGIGAATTVLTSDGTNPVWAAPAGGDASELFYLVQPGQAIETDILIPANIPFILKAFTASGATNPDVKFFSSADVLLNTSTNVGQTGIELILTTAVAYFQTANTGTDPFWIAISNPISETIDSAQKFRIITSTQSVTLAEDYDAFVVGGGGGGGGVGTPEDCAGGGGGSGLYATGIVVAGTYTATIGAGGSGVSNATGNAGGTSSISGVSAAGGSGGLAGVATRIGGTGGAGGSGGSGGAAENTGGNITNSGLSGFQGANGSTGTGTATPGVGGAGSGVSMPSPVQVLGTSLLQPALVGVGSQASGDRVGLGGGVYAGGGGGGISGSQTPGTTGSSGGGGGGGASGRNSSGNPTAGGAGGAGIIILIERI